MRTVAPSAPAAHPHDDLPMLPTTRLKSGPRRRLWRRRSETTAKLLPHNRLDHSWYGVCKMALEWSFAAVLLVFAAPVMFLAGMLVKLTSRGSVFYSQTRVGKNGKLFTIYKIRTMVNNCESHSGAQWATTNDPRVTRVGKFLRKTHIDELPQLLNVLRCEMSLVGPRPERPEFVPNLDRTIPGYRHRLQVRPGVTGVAQVQLPPDSDLTSVRRKLAYDLYYVQHAGFWLDLRLILCTGIHVVGVPYHVIGRLFFLPGRDAVENAYHERTVNDDSGVLPVVAVQMAQ